MKRSPKATCTLAEFYRAAADDPTPLQFSRNKFIPVLVDEFGNHWEGSLGGPHPRQELFQYHDKLGKRTPRTETGFRPGWDGSPFVHECIFYLSANPDNVRRIADLLEEGVTVEQIPFKLEVERS
jgi:hypothetical protein